MSFYHSNGESEKTISEYFPPFNFHPLSLVVPESEQEGREGLVLKIHWYLEYRLLRRHLGFRLRRHWRAWGLSLFAPIELAFLAHMSLSTEFLELTRMGKSRPNDDDLDTFKWA